MEDPPPAKKPRLSPRSERIHLTEAEQEVVKIQFEKNHRSPKTPPWNTLLEEYCRFLQIKLSDPSEDFAPSYIIDQMWHAHILSTREYFAFCERHNNDGGYVHHDPTMTRGQARYKKTLQAYKLIFKEKPNHPDIWPQHVGQKPKGRAAVAVKKEEETEANEADHQEQQRRAVAVVKKEEETESDEDNHPNQKPRAVVAAVKKEEEEQGADNNNADQESRAAVSTTREQNAHQLPDNNNEEEEEDEGRLVYYDASYDTDEREYLEEYGGERGETLEELKEWHREAILIPANNEGFDPRTNLDTVQCFDDHRWYDREFDLSCPGCLESSRMLEGFSCG